MIWWSAARVRRNSRWCEFPRENTELETRKFSSSSGWVLWIVDWIRYDMSDWVECQKLSWSWRQSSYINLPFVKRFVLAPSSFSSLCSRINLGVRVLPSNDLIGHINRNKWIVCNRSLTNLYFSPISYRLQILRSHVMVRVGGGWDTLSHYLDKHDPCRCRSQHRSSVAARIMTRTNPTTNGIELHKAQVFYERWVEML